MRTGSAWAARLLAASAVVALAACADSTTEPTRPQLKVDPGNANSGFYQCTMQGSPTINKVTADNRQAYINDGYTCTKR